MVKGMKIKVTGIKETQAYLMLKLMELNSNIGTGLKEAGGFLKEEVQSSIEGNRAEPRSVDTGEFLESVDTISSKNSVSVYSNVDQSKFMEYGTSKIKARRHFGNSKDRNKNKIINIIKDNIKI